MTGGGLDEKNNRARREFTIYLRKEMNTYGNEYRERHLTLINTRVRK